MKGLDREFAREVIERFGKLEPGMQPKWGKLKSEELVSHMIAAIKHARKEIEGPAFMGNWFTTTILPPIVWTGLLLPPKNLKTKTSDGEETGHISVEGDLDDLAQTMEGWISDVESGTLTDVARHPLFGDISAEKWCKVHKLHFKHHFKQFGI